MSLPQTSKRRKLVFAAIAVALVLAYAVSLLAYGASLDPEFAPPQPAADEVAVVLVPTSVDGDAATVIADVLIFPGAAWRDGDALTKDVVVTLSPAVAGASLVFPAGEVPSPQEALLPAPGIIEKYPLDSYELRTRVRVEVGSPDADPAQPQPVTAQPQPVTSTYDVFLNAAGWTYRSDVIQSTEGKDRSLGVISRTGPSILIASIFVALILAFGVMGVLVVVSILRGRYRPEMSTAGWLTAALFALISLRNSLPGDPPLGSWIDVLVYYWVVAVLMIMVVTTIATLLTVAAARAKSRD